MSDINEKIILLERNVHFAMHFIEQACKDIDTHLGHNSEFMSINEKETIHRNLG